VTQQHSLLGASGAARWLRCPGSFRLSQHAPPSPSSIYAATGTLAHEWIERTLKDGVRLDRLRIGDTHTVEGHAIEIDQDFVDGVQTMLDYVASVQPQYDQMAVEVRVSVEPYFKRRGCVPPVPMFGRVDVALVNEHQLEIVDYKNGSGVLVDPVDNPQVLYYAAGVVAELHRRRPPVTPERIVTTIVQPHARSVAKVRSAAIDYLDLMLWVDDVLIPGVAACDQPDAPLVPGSWCRFCPVSFSCPALVAEANRMAKLEFDDDRVEVEDDQALSELLDTAVKARAWCDAIEGYALRELQRQRRVPGWSLVPTRPVRKWINETNAGLTLSSMQVTDIYRRDLKTPAQIEKLVRKQLSNRAWEGQIAPMVESVSSGVKLQRDDTRPAEDFDPC